MAEKAEILLSAKDTTASAFQAVQGRLTTLKAGIAGFAGGAAFGAIQQGAELIARAFEKIDPRSVFDAADQLNKLSQRTGDAVEVLGSYQYAAKLANVEQGELEAGLKRLSVNIAAAARGEKEQAEAFKVLGISVKDASGQVRTAGDVLGDVAERFSTYKDGANKVALANAIGGKSFEKLIPLLNGGRQGLIDAREELEKFGGVISGDLARKSEQFNDNMTRLGVASNALKVALASGLIDRLVETSNQMVETAKQGGLLAFALEQAKRVLSGQASREFAFGKDLPPDKLKEAQEEVARLTPIVAKLQAQLTSGGGADVADRLDRLMGRLRAAKVLADAEEARGARIGGGRGVVNPALVVPAKAEAPALKNTHASNDAEALLRKQLEGRIKAIQDGLERERDLFQFSQSQLAELFAHGESSIDEFYAAKAKAQQDYLAKQVAGFQAEITLQREFESKAAKPQDKQDAANKIIELNAQIAKAERESGQAALAASTQQQRAFEDAAKSLLDLDAQIAELSGDKLGSALKRNALAVQEFQKQLARVGGDPAREASLRKLLEVQAQFNQIQRDNANITERAQIAEEAFTIQADRAGKSRIEAETGVKAIREDSIRQLDELIAKTALLVQGSTDPELIHYFEKLKIARDRAFDARSPELQRLREASDEAGKSLASGIEDFIVDGKKASDVIKQLEKDFVRLVTRDFLTTPLATSFSNFLKQLMGAGGTAAGGVGGGDLFSIIGRLFGLGGSTAGAGQAAAAFGGDVGLAFGHNGGLAGSMNTFRRVAATDFAGAERYHRGGLAHDEVPAILRKREEVLRTDDPRHRDNWAGGGRPVTNNNYFTLQQPASRDTQSAIALRVYQATQRAQSRDG